MSVIHEFGNFVMSHLDDIIFSPTLEEQTKPIQKIFDHLRQHDVKLKPPKCKFTQDQTQYELLRSCLHLQLSSKELYWNV